MRKESKLAALRRVLGREAFSKGDEHVFFCPKCRHRKPKLSVNLVTDRANCWVCHFAGRTLAPLLALKSGNPDLIEYLNEREPVGEKVVSYDPVVMPRGYVSLANPGLGPYHRRAIEFLASRGVERDDIVRMKLGYVEDGEYRDRIVFPSFDAQGNLNFVTARGMYDWVYPRYKTGNNSKDIVFNEYLIDWREPVVLTEGPFDALVAGENAIPLQGTIVSRGSVLLRKIIGAGVPVYFAFDSDAMDVQLEAIEMFMAYGIECLVIDLGGRKDVGEMTRDEFAAAKQNARLIDGKIAALEERMATLS